jgi:NHLM bacteriocin system ABC transporter ATP-binding protein
MTVTDTNGTGPPGADVRWLARYGDAVDCTAQRRIPLTGTAVVWLVIGGSLDLFAATRAGYGRWHFVGKATAGTIVTPSPPGADCQLVARPEGDCELHRLDIATIAEAQRRIWSGDRVRRGHSVEEELLAAGVDAGLRLLNAAVRPDEPVTDDDLAVTRGSWVELDDPRALRSAGPMVWIELVRGEALFWGMTAGPGDALPICAGDRVHGGPESVLTARSTADLLVDGTLWRRLVTYEAAFHGALGRRVLARERREAAQLAAGRWAGDQALVHAVDRLREQVESTSRQVRTTGPTRAGPDDAVPLPAVLELVAAASGVTLSTPADLPDLQPETIERFAQASNVRTRPVRLERRWWRTDAGPLLGYRVDTGAAVALLWKQGGYEAADPGYGFRERITPRTAARYAPIGVMLYPPLPEDCRTLGRLLRYGLVGSRTDIARLLIGGVAAVTLGLLVPVVTGYVLGRFVPAGDRGLILQSCLAVVAATMAAMAFAIVENLALLRTEGRFEARVQAGVWDRLMRQSTGFFTRYSTGDLASKALGVRAIREILSGVASIAVHAILLGAVNFALQLWYSVPLALLSAALAAANVVVVGALVWRQLVWERRLVALENALTGKALETLRGLARLRVAAAESHAYSDWVEDFSRSQDLHRRVRQLQGAVTVFNAAYAPLSILILFTVLNGPAGRGLSITSFLTFVVAFTAQFAALSQLTAAVASAGSVVPLFAQLAPILAEPVEVASGSRSPGVLSGAIELRDVSFRYDASGPPVLDGLSLHIRPGEFVAIVGPTGCGKSTLLRLLIGFERPSSGAVVYDGQDLATLDVAAVRRQCGVVLQHAEPFSGTILENICGTERFPTEQVWEAARLAGLDRDIAGMPMGLHTVLTDNGATLSGGQRQRLMIAQALIRKPRILLFDEATSALDNETQRIVAASTEELQATRIVIAHRLSTVLHADRVVALDRGRIVQSGTPQELLADRTGMFYRLVRRQTQQG